MLFILDVCSSKTDTIATSYSISDVKLLARLTLFDIRNVISCSSQTRCLSLCVSLCLLLVPLCNVKTDVRELHELAIRTSDGPVPLIRSEIP